MRLVGDGSQQGAPEESPSVRRTNVRRIVKLLVGVELAVILLAVSVWLLTRDDERENAVNDGLRGSRPPAGQAWPALDAIDGIEPAAPSRDEVRGAPAMLVATCADCRSGDIIGGFLGRLAPDALPEDARVVVLTWDGDQGDWAEQWRVDDERFELHDVTTPDATARVRRRLGIGPVDGAEESGITFLHDTQGRWRSTFYVGQLDAGDMAHDLEQLAD